MTGEFAPSGMRENPLGEKAGSAHPEEPARTNRGDAAADFVSEDADEDYVTNHVTNDGESRQAPKELLVKNGRHEETRTPDLYRVKAESRSTTTTYMVAEDCQVSANTYKSNQQWVETLGCNGGTAHRHAQPITWPRKGWTAVPCLFESRIPPLNQLLSSDRRPERVGSESKFSR